MSYRSPAVMRAAEKQSFNAIDESCPFVDKTLEEAGAKIKEHVTEPFRKELTEAFATIIEQEDRIADLEKELAATERVLEMEREANRALHKLLDDSSGVV